MVAVRRGEVWWADISQPLGPSPGFRRAVVVVQGDSINRSQIATVVGVALTGDMRWADAPGNVTLHSAASGLPKDSVANVSKIVTIDGRCLTERVGSLPAATLELILSGIDTVLGR